MAGILTIPFTSITRRKADLDAALARGHEVHLIFRGGERYQIVKLKHLGVSLPVGFAATKAPQPVDNVTDLASSARDVYIETEEEQQEEDGDQPPEAAAIAAKVKALAPDTTPKPTPDKNDTSYLYAADDLPDAKPHVDVVKGRK